MIIETRYRDIPFEEAIRCHDHTDLKLCRKQWKQWRGKPVRILVPAITRPPMARCVGPFFAKEDKTNSVCPHIAEIGD